VTLPSPDALRQREPNQILLRMQRGTGQAELRAAVAAIDGTIMRAFPIVPGLYQVYTRVPVEVAARRLGRRAGVKAVRPNRRVYPAGHPADDEYFPQQWALENTGQTFCMPPLSGTPGADIRVKNAWYRSKGTDFVIAVIDSGMNFQHQDLSGRIASNPLEVGTDPEKDSDGNGYPGDVHGWNFRPTKAQMKTISDGGTPLFIGSSDADNLLMHGTAVASIVGAEGGNGGMRGVCWYARLLPLQILESESGGLRGDVGSAIAAIDYCATMGVRVSCNSWGAYAEIDPQGGGFLPIGASDEGPDLDVVPGQNDFQDLRDAIDNAGKSADHLFVASAGQYPGKGVDLGVMPFLPAAFGLDNIISVTGSDYNDGFPSFNFGVDLSAPATCVLAADGSTKNDYRYFTGTSFAAPHVAGAAALLWSYLGANADHTTIKQALLKAARKLPAFSGVAEGILDVAGAFPPFLLILPKNDLDWIVKYIEKLIDLGLIKIQQTP